MENNGFSDMSDYLGNIAKVTEEVTQQSLEEAATFYLNKLLPKVPKSLLKKEHMRNAHKNRNDNRRRGSFL